MAAMFDGFRIDHLVGFYRTYWRPASGDAPFFVPADEADQRVLGEAVIEAFASAGAALIAEDLGTIPDFVRASLESLQLPGYKVLRWERQWHVHGQPFHDPATYAAGIAGDHRHARHGHARRLVGRRRRSRRGLRCWPYRVCVEAGVTRRRSRSMTRVRDALIEVLMRSGSDLVVFPLQDLFGWRDRINVPATVGPTNWSWASPIPVDRLMDDPVGRERAETLRAWCAAGGHGR